MAVKLEFYLSDNDFDRLMQIKSKDKRDYMTGNEYAALLLSKLLRKKQPQLPSEDEVNME